MWDFQTLTKDKKFKSLEEIEAYLYEDPARTEDRIWDRRIAAFLEERDAEKDYLKMLIKHALAGDIPTLKPAITLLEKLSEDNHFVDFFICLEISPRIILGWIKDTRIKIKLIELYAKTSGDASWYSLIAYNHLMIYTKIKKMIGKPPFKSRDSEYFIKPMLEDLDKAKYWADYTLEHYSEELNAEQLSDMKKLKDPYEWDSDFLTGIEEFKSTHRPE